jgi:hypothetical protein
MGCWGIGKKWWVGDWKERVGWGLERNGGVGGFGKKWPEINQK